MFIFKQLRRKKNISQTDLAVAIGVSLRTIQLYEKKNANIPIKNLTKIAQYFEMTLSELYRLELEENQGLYHINGTNLRGNSEFKTLENNKYLAIVPLITEDFYAAYVRSYEDDDFILKRPRVSFVLEHYDQSECVAFEIANRAMDNGEVESIPLNSVVLGKLVSKKNIGQLIEKHHIFIIVYKEGILCKEIVGVNEKQDTIICHSFNTSPEYADFAILLKDINQLFAVIKKQVDS
ncbi:helix-turn-helix transcriptional regulator [Flavobacteriaceae bacterium TP-CH-4]|uniref:Helix-turn-helix transcriptional regulator n=1 Tax=Pelagihabitans pacificus TaxID=2696054 RepID=A0A967AUQ2_9FLAO|nr:helix-turn-helix transcriptional regulator [Pelagihabitans pacificus]NHF60292.1 helix-turn-helix transcriptional regulator [Pelagihabitans pacificus]